MKTAIKISKHIPSVFQGSFDFTKRRAISLSVEHPLEQTALRWLVALIVVFLCTYLYFVSMSVLNVIARKEALSQISRIESSISTKEHDYFALSEEVVPSTGDSLGLSPLSNITYVYRPGNTALANGATLLQ
jgi:hypothetical protein